MCIINATQRECSSMVEHHLAKVNVVSSSLITRSSSPKLRFRAFFIPTYPLLELKYF